MTDREALLRTASQHVLAAHYPPDIDAKNAQRVRDQCWTAVDAVLPLLTDALDRARQQGRDEAAAAIEAECGEVDGRVPTGSDTPRVNAWVGGAKAGMRLAARLARGGPNRKDEE